MFARAQSGTQNGGNITFVAQDGGSNLGSIAVSGMVYATGNGGGSNGTVEAVSGLSTGATAIDFTSASVNVAGGTTGSLTLSNTVPAINVTVSRSTGVADGSFVGTTAGAGDVFSGPGSVGGGKVLITAGRDVHFQNGISVSSNRPVVDIRAGRDFLQNGGAGITGKSVTVTAGRDIALGESMFANDAMTWVAGRNILNNRGSLQVGLNNGGNGGNFTAVAGADFSQNDSSIQVIGASATGGKIDFNSTGSLYSLQTNGTGTGNGGKITMAAFEGSDQTGSIRSNGGSIQTASGDSSGTNGTISLISGKADQLNTAYGINMSGASLDGSGPSANGGIYLSNTTPAATTITTATGALSNSMVGTTRGGADVISGPMSLSGGNFNVEAGHDYSATGALSGGGFPTTRIVAAHDILQSGGASLRGGSLVMTAGHDIHIGEALHAADGMTLVAGHDILNYRGSLQIFLNEGTAASNLTMVAGANYTDNGSTITVTPSTTGGAIDFNTSGSLYDIEGYGRAGNGGKAANLNFVAFEGTDNTGYIKTNGGNVFAYGTLGQPNGTVNFISNKADVVGGYAIDTNGAVIQTNGTANGGDAINLLNVAIASGVSIDKTTGAPSSSFATSTIQGGDIKSGAMNMNGGSLTVLAGRDYLQNGAISGGTAPALRINALRDYTQAGGATLRGTSVLVTAGRDISFGESLTANSGMTIIAGRDIVNNRGGWQIFTNGTNLNMIAGADFTEDGTKVTVTPSTTGGLINFNGGGGYLYDIEAYGTGTGNGGNLNFVAYEGSDKTGYIKTNGGTIYSYGAGGGTNGDITFVAGKNDQLNTTNAIDTYSTNITYNGGPNNTSGSITLANVQAASSVQILKANAAPQSSFLTTTVGAADISTGSLGLNGGTLSITAGNDLLFRSSMSVGAKPSVRLAAGHDLIQNGGAAIVGSPVVITAGHDISIGESMTTTSGMTMVAGHDVVNHRGSLQLFTNGTNLNIIAGANFSEDGTSLTVTPSATGGLINFNGTSGSLYDVEAYGTGTANGGNINFVAYEGSDKTGYINMPGGTILAYGVGGGTNGNITLVSGKNDQLNSTTAINTTGSNITLNGGPNNNSGSITLANVQAANNVQILKSGATAQSTFLTTTVGAADISTGTMGSMGAPSASLQATTYSSNRPYLPERARL